MTDTRLPILALPLLMLAACASTPETEDLTAYPAALLGTWSNAAQIAQAPDDVRRPPAGQDADHWIDAQTVTFSPDPASAPAEPTLRAEWRGGGVTRRETWTFRRGGGAVRLVLGGDDVPGSGDAACALTISGAGKGAWNAQTDPERCQTPSAKGAAGLDVRITVMPTGLLVQSTARLPDDTAVFRRPGGLPYDLRRVP